VTTRQQTRDSGPFISGEIPLPFTVKFDPVDIDFQAGFTLAATMENHDGTERTFAGAVEWEDAAKGLVRVEFDGADVLLGADIEHEDRLLMIWTGDGTTRPATLRIKVPIDWSVGTPPSI
jgi:hypothetical protein